MTEKNSLMHVCLPTRLDLLCFNKSENIFLCKQTMYVIFLMIQWLIQREWTMRGRIVKINTWRCVICDDKKEAYGVFDIDVMMITWNKKAIYLDITCIQPTETISWDLFAKYRFIDDLRHIKTFSSFIAFKCFSLQL